MTKFCFAVGLAMLAGATPVFAQDDQARLALDNLVAAYPSALAGHDDRVLRWRDGTAMPVSDSADSKTLAEFLRHASILDQFRIPYPRGPLEKPPAVDADPGRFRNTAFFTKMYGDCQKGEVSPLLVSLAWLPKTLANKTFANTALSKSIRITSLNGVDEHLRAVSAEIDALPEDIKHAAYPIAGLTIAGPWRTLASRAHTATVSRSISIPPSRIIGTGDRTAALSFIATACRKRSSRSSKTRLHLGREVVSLRHDALRISARTPCYAVR